jgi:hypothetical protein
MWIKRFDYVDDAMPEIAPLVLDSGERLIRIEGVPGAGKSTLAVSLAHALGARVVHGDDYAYKASNRLTFAQRVCVPDLQRRLDVELATGTLVVIDAICLSELAPAASFGRGYRIYVRRLSFNTPTMPLWHGFDEHSPTPRRELDRSVHLYHLRERPHERADALIEIPDLGHTLSGPIL